MRKIMIANGKYTGKDGQEKTQWVKVGVIGTSQNGKDYVLLDPTVNLAGFQREMGKDMLMCSVFEDQPQAPQHVAPQQSQPNPAYAQQQQYQAPQQQQQQAQPTYETQEIPF